MGNGRGNPTAAAVKDNATSGSKVTARSAAAGAGRSASPVPPRSRQVREKLVQGTDCISDTCTRTQVKATATSPAAAEVEGRVSRVLHGREVPASEGADQSEESRVFIIFSLQEAGHLPLL